MKQAKTTKRETLSENSTHIYYKDGTIHPKNYTPPTPTTEVKHTQGEWEWKKITKKQLIIGLKNYGVENGDYRKDNQCGQIAQIHGWDGEQPSELSPEDYANAELIVKAVNERHALLDALKKIQRELDILKGQTYGDIQTKIGEINRLSVDTIKKADPNW